MGYLSLFLATVFCCCQHTSWAALEKQGTQAYFNNSGTDIEQRILNDNINVFAGKSKTCCPCNSGEYSGKYSHTSDCTQYFECNWRSDCKNSIRRCDKGFRFDYESRQCELIKRIPCIIAEYKKYDGSCTPNGILDKNACKDISLRCPTQTNQCDKNNFVRSRCRKYCGLCECGVVKHVSRIVGGKKTVAHQYPWMATIVHRYYPELAHCGGSVINSNWILTAAHCFYYERKNFVEIDDAIVLLGRHNLHTAAMQIKPKKLIRHKHFDANENDFQYASFENDIALLEVEEPIEFSDIISPVCLPPPNKEYIGKTAIALGYGDIGVRMRPLVLMEVELSTISNYDCMYVSNRYNGITENMLCAWQQRGGMDTCKGDSGGPLITFENNLRNEKQYVQIGIVSIGPTPCGEKEKPSVYTNVAKYIDWIDNNTYSSDPNGYIADVYTRK